MIPVASIVNKEKADVLDLTKYIIWFIFQATCATSGEGLYEGLDWLSNQLKNANR